MGEGINSNKLGIIIIIVIVIVTV